MTVADLHAHTTNSDGTLELREFPAAAREAGLDAVAVTDHDRLHPDLDAPAVSAVPGEAPNEWAPLDGDELLDAPETEDAVALLHGIELRVDAGAQRVDLLGYAARRTDALHAEIDRLQRDRIERAAAMLDRIEDRLGVAVPLDPQRGVGRPDIARAVLEVTDYESVDAVFSELIGHDCPCYVARDVPEFDRGRELLADACGVVGLAHPLRYRDPDHALDLAPDLDAVEVHYPYDHDADTGRVARVAERHDLLVTGGSDAHDRTLGRASLSAPEYDHLARALADGRA